MKSTFPQRASRRKERKGVQSHPDGFALPLRREAHIIL